MKPHLDSLENRVLLAGVSFSNGVLTIIGTDNADTVLIQQKFTTLPGGVNMESIGIKLSSLPGTYVYNARSVKQVVIRCAGGNDFIDATQLTRPLNAYGGAGFDTMLGGSANDALYGETGRASIEGNGGNDLIQGGTDADILNGGAGNDQIYGSAGADKINGGIGDDCLSGGAGDDCILGGLGNDYESGGVGNDTLLGDDGNDTLYADQGDDQAYGSTGNDFLNGGDGNDSLSGGANNDNVAGRAGNDAVTGGSGNDILNGDAGIDTLYGETGDDALYGGADADLLNTGAGNDSSYGGAGEDAISVGVGRQTVVTIGGGRDKVKGGDADDNFWTDEAATDVVVNTTPVVHRVTRFMNGVSKELNADHLADPTPVTIQVDSKGNKYTVADGWDNYRTTPLFATGGPIVDNTIQQNLGTCYLISTLAGLAKVSQPTLYQRLVALGDGTFAAEFRTSAGAPQFVRVDADLPTLDGAVSYAQLSADNVNNNTLWTAIFEKAYAAMHSSKSDPNGTYVAINGGNPFFVAVDLGLTADMIGHPAPGGVIDMKTWTEWTTDSGSTDIASMTATQLLNWIQSRLTANRAVVFGTADTVTRGSDTVVYSDHAYMVERVNFDAGNPISITLRNPWGHDVGGGDTSADSNAADGYVTLNLGEVLGCFANVCAINPIT